MKNSLKNKIKKSFNLDTKKLIGHPLRVLKKINIENLTKITTISLKGKYESYREKIKQKEKNKMANILGKIFSAGAGELVKSVGGVIDNLHTSEDEKLAAAQKVKELIATYEIEMEKQVTSRWDADMKSDSWLSKNVRPMVLIFLVVSTVLMIFIDAETIKFVVEPKWTDLLQLVLITVIGAYFGGRSLEKTKK